ncbi:hypothetical protein ACVNP0_05195 [Staphylococcus aureus]
MPDITMGQMPSIFPRSAKNIDAVIVTAFPIQTKSFIPELFLPAFTAKFSSAAKPIPALIFGRFISI